MNDTPDDIAPDISRALLGRVPSMLAYFDTRMRCVFANAAYAQGVGTTPALAVGRTMEELLGPWEFAHRQPHVVKVLSGEAQRFERVVAATAGQRHLLVSYVPDEEGGTMRGFVVEITELTALRAAEVALRHSEARFRTLSESSPLGVYFADVSGKRTYMNTRWQEIYGLSESQGLGDGWMRALHEDDREAVTAAWREMALQGRELELSFRIRRGGDGDVRVLRTRTRPVRDGEGAVIGFVGVLEDITDRRADEERLRASEALLDRTGRVARIGGWEVDLRTRAVRWSAHTRRICEVADDFVPEFMGGHRFYPPYAWEELTAAVAEATRSGRNWDLELPFTSAKGRQLWVRVFGEAELEEGMPVRLLGALQDVTEQRRQKADFTREQARRLESERHAAELDRLLRERSEMLDVMAHEVRQPLNNASAALQGAASVMAEMHEAQASQRLLRAQSVLGQVMASIDNTLAVASLLARPDAPEFADADIDALLAVSIADMPASERSRIRIDRATRARTAPMDTSLMRLAVRNLLANAIRYSPSNSPVVVRISDSDEPLGLVLEVSNEGGPIPPGEVERLFERGSKRAPGDAPSAQAQPHGLGLGLYIVRRVMELHGGLAELVVNEDGLVAFRLLVGPGDD